SRAGLIGNVQRDIRTGKIDHAGIFINRKAKPEHDREPPLGWRRLVQGWHEEAWGHHFMADENLADMLSADFSGLIVPDGERSNSTLAENPHARRFVKAFVENGKPVLAVADAVSL
ncbi:MAG: DJ-1/PfpI family protein, partial [Alphaproteobacteria bacterium]